MGVGNIVGIVIILTVMIGVIVFIIVNNQNLVSSIKEAQTTTAALGNALQSTQDVINNNMVTKDNVSDIQNGLATSLDSTKKIFADSVITTQKSLESESKNRVQTLNQVQMNLDAERSDREASLSALNQELDGKMAGIESNVNTQISGMQSSLDSTVASITDSMKVLTNDTLNKLNNVDVVMQEEVIMRSKGDTDLAARIEAERQQRITTDLEINKNINDMLNTMSGTFTSDALSISRGLSFASTNGSYMLTASNDTALRLEVSASNNSNLGLSIVGTDKVMKHMLGADGVATHQRGVRIMDTNCVDFNVNSVDKAANSSKICHGDDLSTNLNIYGGGTRVQGTRTVRLMDDVHVTNSLNVKNKLKVGNFVFEATSNGERLYIRHESQAGNVPVAMLSGNISQNRMEVYGGLTEGNPMFYVSNTGSAQGLVA